MLGPPKPRRLNEPIAVSRDDLVPPDHCYRHPEATLDLGFVREWAKGCYAERGRSGIDPVVFFKLQPVMFFEGIRSERMLIQIASLHLAHRWYLGYALDDPLPDHFSLTRIRQRLRFRIFERFFEQVVDLRQEAGLVWSQELVIDATKVRAHAAVESLVPRFYAEAKAHLADLFPDDAAAANGPGDAASDSGPARSDGVLRFSGVTVGAGQPPAETWEPRWDLLGERRLDPSRPSSGSYQRTSGWRVSTTDPDATPMRIGGRTHLGYRDHYVVDGGKARVILAALVTPADVMENQPMRDLLRRVRFRRKPRPGQVTGDTAYSTVENVVAIEDAGIRAYVPLPDFDRRTAGFGKHEFRFDAEADAYRCPGGAELRPLKHRPALPVRIYHASAAACNACSLKARCTSSDRGHRIARLVDEAELDRVRAYHATEACKKAMRKRQVRVEPLFAEAKAWHGLRRLRLRGLANANIQGLWIAAGQNLTRLLAATGWGRRHAPCGSLVAFPEPSRRLAASPS